MTGDNSKMPSVPKDRATFWSQVVDMAGAPVSSAELEQWAETLDGGKPAIGGIADAGWRQVCRLRDPDQPGHEAQIWVQRMPGLFWRVTGDGADLSTGAGPGMAELVLTLARAIAAGVLGATDRATVTGADPVVAAPAPEAYEITYRRVTGKRVELNPLSEPACGCPVQDGMVRHQRGACTDPVVIKLGWFYEPGGGAAVNPQSVPCCTLAVHDSTAGWWCPEHGDPRPSPKLPERDPR
jgi:hypothetical protein